jgi:hypothetical protein
MIKHIVVFKFKAEAPKSDIKAAIESLRALPGKIDVIRKFEVGENVLPSERAWHAALIGEYDNLAALEVYSKHPDHLAVVTKLREITEAIGSVDYEL